MRKIDRVAINDFGVSLLQMMENAGRSLAQAAIQLFKPRTAVVLAGSGGNGGGGMAAARHLTGQGVHVHVHLTSDTSNLTTAGAHQRATLLAMGIDVHAPTEPPQAADLVIDAMVGYSLHTEPDEHLTSIIKWMATSGAPVLALDVPTGFSAAAGTVSRVHVTADATLTLAAPKRGLAESASTGTLLVADIGIPGQVFTRLGLPEPQFPSSWIVDRGSWIVDRGTRA
ncbi:MAG: NAD(P)H-hydrate epimerase [Candidatus Nanopelagicales bacterium]|nr:NAD(P)H-hydrate epimerase [Candidatus Nanopelagicales bacterium]